MPNSTLPAGMMMLATAHQRDTPKALISGGRMSVTRQVRGPIQPSENRMDKAKLVRNRPYLHGKRMVAFLFCNTTVLFSGPEHISSKQ